MLGNSLQGRLGRRLLALFLLCSVAPIVGLAVLALIHGAQQLRDLNQARMREVIQVASAATVDRFTLADLTLRTVEFHLGDWWLPSDESHRMLEGPFAGVRVQYDDGTSMVLHGKIEAPPADPSESVRGQTRIRTLPVPGGFSCILMQRRLGPEAERPGVLLGKLRKGYLEEVLSKRLLSPTSSLCLLDPASRPFVCSLPDGVDLEPAYWSDQVPSEGRSFELPFDGESRLGYRWPLRLEAEFDAEPLTIVLTESEAAIFGPIRELEQLAALIVMLTLCVVGLVGLRQIRRRMVPLEELRRGTREIALGNFSSVIRIDSQDEFEELGHCFNEMADQLRKQFAALTAMSEVDRAALTTVDARVLAERLLTRLPEACPCAAYALALPESEGSWFRWRVLSRRHGDPTEWLSVPATADERNELCENPDRLRYQGARDLPSYLEPLVKIGCRSFTVLPLVDGQKTYGLLALGHAEGRAADESDVGRARGMADQATVALANASMLGEIRQLAYFDTLTGLANRTLFWDRLRKTLERAERSDRPFAVFFIDLDHFKRINDTLGHEVGDHLLRAVSERLNECVRLGDTVGRLEGEEGARLARLGGDEFTILLSGLRDVADAQLAARRILHEISRPFRIGDQEIFVTASIGIAVYPYDGEAIEALLKNADTAMYAAKEEGRNTLRFYSESMGAGALQRLEVERELRRALELRELSLVFQPVVDAASQAITGAEALLRWNHPELGMVPPSVFIPVAEETGIIAGLGDWALREACLQSRAWQQQGLPPVSVSVNLSVRQFRHASLVETIERTLRMTGLEGRQLELEITESVLMHNEEESISILSRLKEMGIRLSIDDFGTGYSSLSYLKNLPVDTIKIDRSFVDDVTSDPSDTAITRSIISLAHSLGLHVVGEGVEEPEQLEFLRQEGCDSVQGYLLSPPVDADAFAELLRAGRLAARARASSGS